MSSRSDHFDGRRFFNPAGPEMPPFTSVPRLLLTEYVDPRREVWFRAANALSLNEWERETGKPRRLLIDARLGRSRPHQQHRNLIVATARRER